MAVPTKAQGNLSTIQWQDNDSSDRKNHETCLLFNGKIMTVPTEAPGNLPTIQGKLITFPTEAPGNLPTIQGKMMTIRQKHQKPAYPSSKIMPLLTEAPETCLLFKAR